MANYGKRFGYPLRVAGLGVNKLLALLAVLLVCTHSWGACGNVRNTTSWYNSQCWSTYEYSLDNTTFYSCSNTYPFHVGSCNKTLSYTIKSKYPIVCVGTFNSTFDVYAQYQICSTQAEADSVYCALNPTAEGCSNCKATDSTWYNNAVDSCNAVYGENSYALVDTNDVCEHRGRCCPMDSVVAGNSCAYRCDSIASACTRKNGNLLVSVLRDTTVSGVDSTFYNKCYYNCAYAYNRDSSTALVLGNITLGGPSSAIADGNKAADDFSSIRSVYSGLYVYDYLSPETYEWVDSLAMAPCAVGMYRGIKNGKYVYWKAGQPVPDSVTNVVKIK